MGASNGRCLSKVRYFSISTIGFSNLLSFNLDLAPFCHSSIRCIINAIFVGFHHVASSVVRSSYGVFPGFSEVTRLNWLDLGNWMPLTVASRLGFNVLDTQEIQKYGLSNEQAIVVPISMDQAEELSKEYYLHQSRCHSNADRRRRTLRRKHTCNTQIKIHIGPIFPNTT